MARPEEKDMENGKQRFPKLKNRLFLLIALCVGLWVGFTYVRQEMKLAELKAQEAEYNLQLEALKSEITALEEEIIQSQSSAFIEQMAKEKLKMIKNNEILYFIRVNKKTEAAPGETPAQASSDTSSDPPSEAPAQ